MCIVKEITFEDLCDIVTGIVEIHEIPLSRDELLFLINFQEVELVVQKAILRFVDEDLLSIERPSKINEVLWWLVDRAEVDFTNNWTIVRC